MMYILFSFLFCAPVCFLNYLPLIPHSTLGHLSKKSHFFLNFPTFVQDHSYWIYFYGLYIFFFKKK
ncbi:hypothetical protein CLU79DRAFT_747841 [Phycomyces nitens]|nr:hypothetical protein CLU79DRAFT_747841 [Phycomyces nitens]